MLPAASSPGRTTLGRIPPASLGDPSRMGSQVPRRNCPQMHCDLPFQPPCHPFLCWGITWQIPACTGLARVPLVKPAA